MGKTLVIAEKPSVASDIAKALGKFKKEKDYFENEEYIISSAVGHLVEIRAPESVEPKRGKWKIENLPVIPPAFELSPIEKTEARFKLLKKFLLRKDVDTVINACDAGREGELIFRYILQLAGVQKPMKRLWLQSMTPQSIRQGFQELRDGKELEPLAHAAMCRSEADWLIGINGTRALTSFNSQGGGFQKTTVGRVQTPTLAILVDREIAIKTFMPKDYWEVHATFSIAQGTYEARWFDESFKKSDDADLKAERIWNEALAKDICQRCVGKKGDIQEDKKNATQLSPLLYDLTSLQRDANARFGISARNTLALAQALYEKHKVITYPRTDSRYLPEDYLGTVRSTLTSLKDTSFSKFAENILKQNWVKPNKRIFNQAKVSDHFAIIPTQQVSDKLSEPEQKIYSLIVKRFLAIFYPPAVFEVTTRITRIENDAFKTEGKILIDSGWLTIYGKEEQTEDDLATLPSLTGNEKAHADEVKEQALATKPPARFSEATLLSAMEGAGKLVEDDELRDAMGAKGLGTPATRASIIEGLIAENYVRREGRELNPTSKAFHLMETLSEMDIPALRSPELTGEWEYKLKLIEKQALSRPEFMDQINQATRGMVEKVRAFQPDQAKAKEIDLVDPFSGTQMIETLRDYRTQDGSLTVRKAIAGRIMELHEVRELLEKRMLGPLDGFISKMGRPFSACVKLNDDKTVALDWGAGEGKGTLTLLSEEPVGKCPLDGGNVFAAVNAYICENTNKEQPTCTFRMASKILNQEITPEQARKILETGKSDLLTGFISQKTRRPFKAFLVLNKGKITFEFPPREERKPARGKTKKKAS